ncbi:MAG: DNA-protecting protein DprA [Planctomycetes bacterium]|nr:DNA-protecting protein DprA [Planctomycetota bacterium]
MADVESRRSVVRLHLAEGVGPVIFGRLVKAFGGADGVFRASAGQLQGVEGVGPKIAAGIQATTWEQVDEEFEETQKHGVNIITVGEPEYPAALKNIYDPPAVLYVRGRIEPADALAVGVVGTRHCTHYGMEQADRLCRLMAGAGLTIVSGGARGIDTASHFGAIEAGGRTIAVMGCGLCHAYPAENAKLFDRIVEEGRGAIVSELPMRTAVLAGNFPTRNRIISGLSLGVIVVEAGRRSGALHTSSEAAQQGRPVMAVPGRIDSPLSQGANELIRQGATLVQNLDDILEELGHVGQKMAPDEKQEQAKQQSLFEAAMDQSESALFALLAEGPLGLDELVRRSGLDGGKAAASMTMLVLKGAVAQQPGGIFARKTTKRD